MIPRPDNHRHPQDDNHDYAPFPTHDPEKNIRTILLSITKIMLIITAMPLCTAL